jgi:succinoglycan biosynthesis protein ExoO
MNETPLVSVIMANFNGAQFLGASMQSLIQQTVTSWELILIDDASTDGSVAVAHQSANGDPRVKIVRKRHNGGPAAARNHALDIARGHWIAVFDSDDLMAPRRLECLLARAEEDRATIVADNLMLFSEQSSQPRLHLKNGLERAAHWIGLSDLIESNCLYSRIPDLGYLKPMIQSEFIAKSRARYDEQLRLGEDYYFLASLLAQGQRLRLEPSALYLYRKHDNSVSHRMSAENILALLDADQRFLNRALLTHAERQSLERRRRSLHALLVYDRVIHAIKQGNPGRGAGLAIRHPRVWPLLTRPLTARLKRVRQALGTV